VLSRRVRRKQYGRLSWVLYPKYRGNWVSTEKCIEQVVMKKVPVLVRVIKNVLCRNW